MSELLVSVLPVEAELGYPASDTLYPVSDTLYPSSASRGLTVETMLKLTCWVCGAQQLANPAEAEVDVPSNHTHTVGDGPFIKSHLASHN